jgi:hypothetical protein
MEKRSDRLRVLTANGGAAVAEICAVDRTVIGKCLGFGLAAVE